MISEQMISNCIKQAADISKIKMAVTDTAGALVTKAGSIKEPEDQDIISFIDSDSAELECKGQIFIRICDENEAAYVLVCEKGEAAMLCARLTAAQLENLITAYRDKNDRNTFSRTCSLTISCLSTCMTGRQSSISKPTGGVVSLLSSLSEKEATALSIWSGNFLLRKREIM